MPNFIRNDTQYDLLRKILQTLNEGGIPPGSIPNPLPVLPPDEFTPIDPALAFDSAGIVDAFGRIRTSEPQTVLAVKHTIDDLQYRWSTVEANGGTLNFNTGFSTATLSVSGAGAYVIHQTRRRAYYQPGKSQLAEISFLAKGGQAPADARWRVGLWDGDDGMYLEGNGRSTSAADLSFNLKGTSWGTRTVTGANWNTDPMDGTGPSGVVLDPTKSQLVWFDCEWLGVGGVRCGFIIGGKRILCHRFNWNNDADSEPGVYCSTLNLPIRYQLEDLTGSGSSVELDAICGTVKSEGGQDNVGSPQSSVNAVTIAAAGVIVPMIGIRLNDHHAVVRPADLEVAVNASSVVRWSLYWNPTIGGAGFAWAPGGPGVDVGIGTAASTLAGGLRVAAGHVVGTAQSRGAGSRLFTFDTNLGEEIGGTFDELVLAAEVLTGTNVPVYSQFGWLVNQ